MSLSACKNLGACVSETSQPLTFHAKDARQSIEGRMQRAKPLVNSVPLWSGAAIFLPGCDGVFLYVSSCGRPVQPPLRRWADAGGLAPGRRSAAYSPSSGLDLISAGFPVKEAGIALHYHRAARNLSWGAVCSPLRRVVCPVVPRRGGAQIGGGEGSRCGGHAAAPPQPWYPFNHGQSAVNYNS